MCRTQDKTKKFDHIPIQSPTTALMTALCSTTNPEITAKNVAFKVKATAETKAKDRQGTLNQAHI